MQWWRGTGRGVRYLEWRFRWASARCGSWFGRWWQRVDGGGGEGECGGGRDGWPGRTPTCARVLRPLLEASAVLSWQ